MTRALPAHGLLLLVALVACKDGGGPGAAADAPICGHALEIVPWQDSWLPRAMDVNVETDHIPLSVDDIDEGRGGTAYAALLGGFYNLRVQRPIDCIDDNGEPCMPFGYLYDPVSGRYEDDESIHRQVVAALAQIRLYALFGRPEFRVSAADAIRLLAAHVNWRDDGRARLLDMGATALMAATVGEWQRSTGDLRWSELLDGLGLSMLLAVDGDGRLNEGSALVFAQSHQALLRLYAATGEPAYRDALMRLAGYAHANLDQTGVGGIWEFPYIYGLWANEPLVELHRESGEDWLVELVFVVGDDVMTRQYGASHPSVVTDRCDWRGGFTPNSGSGPPNWNSTIKLEAMVDAWRMADRVGDAAREQLYRQSAESGLAWMAFDQYRLSDVAGHAEAGFAVGGYPLYVDDPDIRIDIPGHGSIAVAKGAAWLTREVDATAFTLP